MQEICGLDSKNERHADEQSQRRRAGASFDPLEVLEIDAERLCEPILRETAMRPLALHIGCNGEQKRGDEVIGH